MVTKIIYTDMPFYEVSIFDSKENLIAIDHVFEGTPEAKSIIEHELYHKKSKSRLNDLLLDIFGKGIDQKHYAKILNKKKFSSLGFFIPISGYKLLGKWKIGFIWERLIGLVILIILIGLVI